MSQAPLMHLRGQLQWFEQMGCTLDVGLRRPSGAFITRHTDLQPHAVETSLLGWLRHENAVRQADAYVRGHRRAVFPIVFLDDVPTVQARRIAHTYRSLVVETSPGRCHVWLVTDAALDETQRKAVQQRLAAGDARLPVTADPASTSGEHYGRLAGLRNRKLGRDCWVNLLAARTTGTVLQVSDWLTETVRRRPLPVEPHAAAQPSAPLATRGAPALSPSEHDWHWVLTQLEAGRPPADVEPELIARCAARRGTDAERYARWTMTKALTRVAARMLERDARR